MWNLKILQMKILKIKAAILQFNQNRSEDEEKLTQSKLGQFVLPEMNPKTAGWYISMWCEGLETGKMTPTEIDLICEKTGVDANFLFGHDPKFIK
jgi:hypothetical protein